MTDGSLNAPTTGTAPGPFADDEPELDPALLAQFGKHTLVTGWLLDAVRDHPEAVALRRKGPGEQGAGDAWLELTWGELADQVSRVATALRALGVGPGDRVVLMLRNRPEFHIADLATVFLRATPISIYNSSAPEQIEYIVGHSRAGVVIVDDAEFLARLESVRSSLADLRDVVVVEPPAELPEQTRPWAALLESAPADLHALAVDQQPDDLVTVIYTSGTTGNPKGVMLDHRNVAWQVAGYALYVAGSGLAEQFADQPHVKLPLLGSYPIGLRYVSYLPMAHIAERMVTHYSWLFLRGTVTTCADQLLLAEHLRAVRPHVLFGPPRVWEKLRSGITAVVAAAGSERSTGFEQALKLGQAFDEAQRAGEVPAALQTQRDALEPVAFRPVRQAVGLDEAVIAFSGAAPLPVEVAQFFRAIGVPFSEVYGMSENTGGMTWSPFEAVPGTVGKPWPGAEVRLADDGEVLCRGGIVARGYLDDPERTADTFDADGWLHSGDIGVWTDDGDLRIVDRKKELIITAGGKNIPPAQLEARLKSHPLVGQALVAGDGRPYLVALLVLDPDTAPLWAAQHDIGKPTLAEMAEHPSVRAELDALVAQVNTHVSQAEGIKRFAVLADEWQPDSAQLTATMKLKRRGVHQAYEAVLNSLYAP